jgi:carboxyl-terminal processing protease
MMTPRCIALLKMTFPFVAGLALGGCATAAKEPPPALTPEQRQVNLESFDYVWTTIRDKHFDPELGGLDWEAIRDELRPQVEQAESMSEARAAMREMIARLGQSHFAIIPAFIYESVDRPGSSGPIDGTAGLDVRVVDGCALVTSVDEGSSAAQAGVRPGWQILRVNQEDLAPRLEAVAEEFAESTYKEAMLASVVQSRLIGSIGETVDVTFSDGQSEPVELELELAERRGRRFQIGTYPPFYVWIETRLIDDSIGYAAFNQFMDPVHVMPVFNKAMASYKEADGVVIDLRGNGGGIIGQAMGMAGWFIAEEDRYLGTLHFRDNELKAIINARANAFTGPLAILTDGLSGSASEIFAGGLKDLGRARIFGSRTPGAALPSEIERLPNGDGFQYAFANYISRGGEALEGKGVSPDVPVVPTREALLAGRDLVLESALAWMRTER